MKEFSVVDAAFYGFGFIKRAPMNFLGVVILMSAMMISFFIFFMPAYADLLSASMSNTSPDAAFAAMGSFYASIGWFIPISIVVGMMIYAAITRALVFDPPPSDWILGIKLGGDELRLLWVYIAVSLMLMGAYAVVGLGGFVLAGALMTASQALGTVAMIVAVVLTIGVMIWLGVRFSVAAAATVGEKQIYIFRAWAMTKGRFWSIFFAYLILYVMIIVVYVVLIFAFAASFGVMAAGSGAGFDPDALRNIGAGPAAIAGAVVAAVIYTFLYGAFFGVGAYVYRHLSAGGAKTVETFE